MSTSYLKPPLTIKQQIQLLKSRGLIIEDEEKVFYILSNISYYRLSGYFYPLLENKQLHTFKLNTRFTDAFNLYCFDRELRKLIFNEIEQIEVSFRTQVVYKLSNTYGAFWLSESKYFKDTEQYRKIIDKLIQEYRNSDEIFIKSFKNKYSDTIPPSWISMEIITFGHLSKLYKLLQTIKEKREIADFYGLSDTVFISWIHCLVYIRNICAHHSRIWNRKLSIIPKTPRATRYPWLTQEVKEDKIYFVLSIIQYFLKTINPNSTFLYNLKSILEDYPQVDYNAMGFPKHWDKELLWQY